jgi:hypothetical protein
MGRHKQNLEEDQFLESTISTPAIKKLEVSFASEALLLQQ